jgi:cell division protein FtsN
MSPRISSLQPKDRSKVSKSSSYRLAYVSRERASKISPQMPPIIQGNRGYFVQAGTFRDFSSMQAVYKAMQKLFTSPYVKLEKVSFGQAKIFRVLVGPFRSGREAESLLKQVSSAGHEQAVVVYNG